MRDVVAKLRNISLAGRKPRISPISVTLPRTLLHCWIAWHSCILTKWVYICISYFTEWSIPVESRCLCKFNYGVHFLVWFSFQKYFLDAKYILFSFLLPLQLLLYYGPKYSVRMPHKANKSQAICNLYQPLQRRHNKKYRDGVSNHQPHDFYSTVYSGTDQIKHQSSASLAFVRGIHRWIPRTNGQLRRNCFHSMTSPCLICHPCCIC